MIACGGGISDTAAFIILSVLGIGLIAFVTMLIITADALFSDKVRSLKRTLVRHSLNINISLLFMFLLHGMLLVSAAFMIPIAVSAVKIFEAIKRNAEMA